MLQTTLVQLLALTNLESGWIFLLEGEQGYRLVADSNLPPALCREDKRPMRCDDCFCLRLYWAEELEQAVTMIECERLHNAVQQCWGETNNLEYHATVPITIRGERLGLLNVGSPGKEQFTDQELAFLESVAYQIGTAVERVKLYEQRERRAVEDMSRYIVNYYSQLNSITRALLKMNNIQRLLEAAVDSIGRQFGWSTVAVALREEQKLRLRSIYENGRTKGAQAALPFVMRDLVEQADREQQIRLAEHGFGPYAVALPLHTHESGVLYLSRSSRPFEKVELEILRILADHVTIALEKVRLYQEWEEVLLAEERNRLARELHDSVNQKLFSLSLLARGIWEHAKTEHEETANAIREVERIAQEALGEMRSLIWQLRPSSEGTDFLRTLKEYAQTIGLRLFIQSDQEPRYRHELELALIRIAQEAMNNVRKHAATYRTRISLTHDKRWVTMKVSDQGRGFTLEQAEQEARSLGLASMRERTEELGGSLHILSEEGLGTVITARLPLQAEERG
ncbi:GAF domain-containing protein [Xylanibacillus composti]|nr:GAF domain-containing protein [Xylanibacillus composti]